MTYFPLNTGAKIPAVGLGTWQSDGASCKLAVQTALEVGYRHLDCAHLYGNEIEVGQALGAALNGGIPGLRREDVFVTSKFWCTTDTSKRVEMALTVSLKNLGVSYLDLYLVHWPVSSQVGDATDPPGNATTELKKMSRRLKSIWRAMEALVERGKVRAIGVSNFGISQIQEVVSFARIIPAVNQVELHPFWRQDELVKFCQSKGIHVSAHTPLGFPGARLGSSGNLSSMGDDEVETRSQPIVFSRSRSVHAPMLGTSAVAVIANRHRKTPAQVILRWGVQRGTSVLPRSLKPERIKSNFDILNWSLSDEDWNSVNTMEPQLRLIVSNQSYLGENGRPLQAVNEMDDVDFH
ncbi:hypothetical protein SELMODRAFT_187317 [Selaginella moellendorffii]|uniref:NADP-dependent oxidoreductase domain-containing protein n=1 Tax=Selaginella moellendorffii TaxID=88036 RepID=D8TC96_SELML|nr:aldo-keto reductase family 4 member C10 [Selaginella moellendorffii]XP_024522701.1 aldo-keto reductase family 4 member C10 [Selaginella moellendorffii]EFJ05725.1 hypothetical protein SELMODRAFT_187317 [Selaginella moellendorffii]|eukprot:XP_002993205.1 aldo-keto reductase family 4 member C10 [Selaginella moellendorffii]